MAATLLRRCRSAGPSLRGTAQLLSLAGFQSPELRNHRQDCLPARWQQFAALPRDLAHPLVLERLENIGLTKSAGGRSNLLVIESSRCFEKANRSRENVQQ